MKNGFFLTIEGPEGAGKTTILKQIQDHFINEGLQVIYTREPGGIEIAEKIRSIILDPSHKTMDGRTEALLYAAARRQHLVEKVIPELEKGKIILCDRFIDSSLAYQGFARGIGVEEVLKINEFAIDGLMPDLTLYFNIDPSIGLERIKQNEMRENNRLDQENLDFHYKVHQGYLSLIEKYSSRIKIVNADQPPERVLKDTKTLIINFLKSREDECI